MDSNCDKEPGEYDEEAARAKMRRQLSGIVGSRLEKMKGSENPMLRRIMTNSATIDESSGELGAIGRGDAPEDVPTMPPRASANGAGGRAPPPRLAASRGASRAQLPPPEHVTRPPVRSKKNPGLQAKQQQQARVTPEPSTKSLSEPGVAAEAKDEAPRGLERRNSLKVKIKIGNKSIAGVLPPRQETNGATPSAPSSPDPKTVDEIVAKIMALGGEEMLSPWNCNLPEGERVQKPEKFDSHDAPAAQDGSPADHGAASPETPMVASAIAETKNILSPGFPKLRDPEKCPEEDALEAQPTRGKKSDRASDCEPARGAKAAPAIAKREKTRDGLRSKKASREDGQDLQPNVHTVLSAAPLLPLKEAPEGRLKDVGDVEDTRAHRDGEAHHGRNGGRAKREEEQGQDPQDSTPTKAGEGERKEADRRGGSGGKVDHKARERRREEASGLTQHEVELRRRRRLGEEGADDTRRREPQDTDRPRLTRTSSRGDLERGPSRAHEDRRPEEGSTPKGRDRDSESRRARGSDKGSDGSRDRLHRSESQPKLHREESLSTRLREERENREKFGTSSAPHGRERGEPSRNGDEDRDKGRDRSAALPDPYAEYRRQERERDGDTRRDRGVKGDDKHSSKDSKDKYSSNATRKVEERDFTRSPSSKRRLDHAVGASPRSSRLRDNSAAERDGHPKEHRSSDPDRRERDRDSTRSREQRASSRDERHRHTPVDDDRQHLSGKARQQLTPPRGRSSLPPAAPKLRGTKRSTPDPDSHSGVGDRHEASALALMARSEVKLRQSQLLRSEWHSEARNAKRMAEAVKKEKGMCNEYFQKQTLTATKFCCWARTADTTNPSINHNLKATNDAANLAISSLKELQYWKNSLLASEGSQERYTSEAFAIDVFGVLIARVIAINKTSGLKLLKRHMYKAMQVSSEAGSPMDDAALPTPELKRQKIGHGDVSGQKDGSLTPEPILPATAMVTVPAGTTIPADPATAKFMVDAKMSMKQTLECMEAWEASVSYAKKLDMRIQQQYADNALALLVSERVGRVGQDAGLQEPRIVEQWVSQALEALNAFTSSCKS